MRLRTDVVVRLAAAANSVVAVPSPAAVLVLRDAHRDLLAEMAAAIDEERTEMVDTERGAA